jgi:hypothetical protein
MFHNYYRTYFDNSFFQNEEMVLQKTISMLLILLRHANHSVLQSTPPLPRDSHRVAVVTDNSINIIYFVQFGSDSKCKSFKLLP